MQTARRSLTCCFLAALLCLPIVFGQTATDQQSRPGMGKIDGATYTNDFFGLQLSIPAQWSVNGDAVKKQLVEKGKEILQTDEKTQEAIDSESAKNMQFLTLSRYPMGSAAANSSFICGGEQLPKGAEIPTGREYLLAMTRYFKNSKIPITLEAEPHVSKLGNAEFYSMDVSYQTRAGKLGQRYYARVMKGYALVFIVTVLDEADRKAMDGILASVSFAGQPANSTLR
ncbi:MAG TPA: hypothetical protein VFK06_10145 [Candidatus Angelobacter sp.]|nr:hypothetical protein [Candidatus Angelobacter sp.]